MTNFWRFYCITASIIFVGIGCSGAQTINVVEKELVIEDLSVRSYTNSLAGYRFDLPDDHHVYERALEDSSKLDPADEDAQNVLLFEESAINGVPGNELQFIYIQDARSAHEWLGQHLFDYIPAEDAILSPGEFAGKDALFVRGVGNLSSLHHVIGVNLDEGILLITQGFRYQPFDSILESFTFIQN